MSDRHKKKSHKRERSVSPARSWSSSSSSASSSYSSSSSSVSSSSSDYRSKKRRDTRRDSKERDSRRDSKERDSRKDSKGRDSRRESKKKKDKKEHKRSKKKSKKKDKKYKKDKKSSSRREDDMATKAKEYLAKAERPTLTKDDYFSRYKEFKMWLLEERKIYFEDLNSEEAHNIFSDFIKQWNDGNLAGKYYLGKLSSFEPAQSSRHRWSFKNMDDVKSGSLRDNVDTMTNATFEEVFELNKDASKASSSRVIGPTIGPTMPPQGVLWDEDEEERKRIEYESQRRKNKEMRDQYELMLDEVAPKLEGREKLLAQKKAKGTHARPDSPTQEFGEKFLMGSSDEVRTLIARQQQRKQDAAVKREAEKRTLMEEKRSQYEAKEAATLAMFREMAKTNKLQQFQQPPPSS